VRGKEGEDGMEDKKITTFTIDSELWRKFCSKNAFAGKTNTEVISTLLRQFIKGEVNPDLSNNTGDSKKGLHVEYKLWLDFEEKLLELRRKGMKLNKGQVVSNLISKYVGGVLSE